MYGLVLIGECNASDLNGDYDVYFVDRDCVGSCFVCLLCGWLIRVIMVPSS